MPSLRVVEKEGCPIKLPGRYHGPSLLTSKLASQGCLSNDPMVISAPPGKVTYDKGKNKNPDFLYYTLSPVQTHCNDIDPNIQFYNLQKSFIPSSLQQQ